MFVNVKGILLRSSLWLAGYVPGGTASQSSAGILCVLLSVCDFVCVALVIFLLVALVWLSALCISSLCQVNK